MAWTTRALVAVAAAAVVQRAAGMCKIYQTAGMSEPRALAKPEPPGKYPNVTAAGIPFVTYNPCPMYSAGEPACCDMYQVESMFVNFNLLNYKFGTTGFGGSPACAANLREAWCHQTCSPDQDKLIVDPHTTKVVVPDTPGEVEVLKYSLNMNKAWACGVYDSCSAVTTVVNGAFNCEGLWNYQGHAPSVQTGQGVYIDFNFIDASMPDAVEAPLQYCCGYEQSAVPGPGPALPGNASSPCSACTGSCPGQVCPVKVHKAPSKFTPAELSAPLYTAMSGFAWQPVAWFYGTILVATVLVAAFQHWQFKKRQAVVEEDSHSLL